MSITVTIAGVDRTAYVSTPIRRSWQVGSICTFSFRIESALAGSYRPAEWDTVVVVIDGYTFFSGVVDNYQEEWHGGGATYQIIVNCTGWTALLERRFVGLDLTDLTGATLGQIPVITPGVTASQWNPGQTGAYWYAVPYEFGSPPSGLPAQPTKLSDLLAFIETLLVDVGLTFNRHGIDGPITEETFNWLSISQILRALEGEFNIVFSVGQDKVIHILDPTVGLGAAPVDITNANGPGTSPGDLPLWQQIRIQRGGLYRNRQGERTSSQSQPSFTTPGSSGAYQLFPIRDATNANPAQLTIDASVFGNGFGPTQLFTGDILSFLSSISGGGWTAIAGNDYTITVIGYNGPNAVITIPVDSTGFGTMDQLYAATAYDPAKNGQTNTSSNYLSRLSYVAWADNATEQARVGFVVEAIEDTRDIQDKSVLAQMAESDLAQGAKSLLKVIIETFYDQFEPGQILHIDTDIPPLTTDLFIEQIESESAGMTADGKLIIRHVVQASDSRFRRGAGLAHQQRLEQAANVPAIPLTGWGYSMIQAETIPGLSNPGLAAGVDPKTYTAPRKGVAQWVTWQSKTAPSVDVNIDILVNGVSIFAPGRTPVIRAGNTFMLNTDYAFLSTPLKVPLGAMLQQQPLTTDAAFTDGVLTIMFAG